MHTSFTFKNLDPSEGTKAYAKDKLDRFDKLLDNPAEASVILTVEKHRCTAEISITGDRLTIIGKEETGDIHSSIDKVLDKLEKQIKKGKQKTREHRNAGRPAKSGKGQESASGASAGEAESEIMVESIEYKPMDVEEAALQLDLADRDFIVFTNSRTGQVNVLYAKKDGDLGLIQPEA
ncbi:MAG: ribosome-associated translation inhibitor RaiA [Deltaproteobacteria bacterium]|nr:ribosome-associated translation inhibitor RaiA [Deltaproteobacteria bacterium]